MCFLVSSFKPPLLYIVYKIIEIEMLQDNNRYILTTIIETPASSQFIYIYVRQ